MSDNDLKVIVKAKLIDTGRIKGERQYEKF